MSKGFVRFMLGAMVATLTMASTVAVAQNVAFEDKQQAVIKNATEPKKTERQTLEQQEGSGPKVGYQTDEMAAAAAAGEAGPGRAGRGGRGSLGGAHL